MHEDAWVPGGVMRKQIVRQALCTAFALAGWTSLSPHAHGQDAGNSEEVERAHRVRDKVKDSEGQAPSQDSQNLNPIEKLGKDLFDRGIYVTSRYTGQFAANPVGGQRQGNDFAGDLTFGLTFDLQKFGLVPGGFVHTLFVDRQGRLLSNQSINTDLSVQAIYGPQTYQLSVFTYEQKLFNDRLDLNFGRTDTAFLTSPYYCDFQSHGDCGRPYALTKITSSSVYPTAVWGGRAAFDVTRNWYTKVGIYQPNPGLQPFNFHGLDFSISHQQGYIVPMEIGYKFANPGASIQNKYSVGFFYSHAPFTQPFLPKQTLETRTAIYAQAQQWIYQPEPGDRGISLFGLFLASTTPQTQAQTLQYSGGLIWQGPSASRPYDRFSLQLNNYVLNGNYLNTLYASRLKAGGSGFPFRSQFTAELNYDIQVNKWAHLMPNIQYIAHPDGLGTGDAYTLHNSKDALVLGLQFSADLTTLLGIPDYPLPLVLDN